MHYGGLNNSKRVWGRGGGGVYCTIVIVGNSPKPKDPYIRGLGFRFILVGPAGALTDLCWVIKAQGFSRFQGTQAKGIWDLGL